MQSPLSGSELERALEEGRIRAKRLLKSFQSSDPSEAAKAANRLRSHPLFSDRAPEELLAQSESVKLKHALDVIALEIGFSTWSGMKHAWEGTPGLPPREALNNLEDNRIFGSGGTGVLLNNWFRNYEEAKAYHTRRGGYLLPHAHQFMVVDADYIRAVGLDPEDPDWTAIGHDWAQPLDREAWGRLDRKLDGWRLKLQEAAKR